MDNVAYYKTIAFKIILLAVKQALLCLFRATQTGREAPVLPK
jgi:hypothetical protein